MAAKKAAKGSPKVEAPEGPGGFRGFGSQALPFLQALRENNERDWFAENKLTFVEECDAPFRELVRGRGSARGEGVAPGPDPQEPGLPDPSRRPVLARQEPLQDQHGGRLVSRGGQVRPGMLYIHVEPGAVVHRRRFLPPEPPQLKAIRSAIAEDPGGFGRMIKALKANGLELGRGEPLARMPKGFEAFADSPIAEPIRFRSFVVSKPMADDDLERRDLPEVVVRFAESALPLLEVLLVADRGW